MHCGEIFGVIGPSKSGNSTVLYSVDRLMQLLSGHVIVTEVNVTELSLRAVGKIRHYMGMIF